MHHSKPSKALFLTLAPLSAAALIATEATAQDSAQADPFVQYAACAVIAADAERLSCYDSLAETMQGAAKTVEAVTTAKAAAFGAETMAENEGKRKDVERASGIESPVTDITVIQSRRLKITLANGQVWRQVADDRVIKKPKDDVDHTAVIRRVMLGRYVLTLEPEGKTIRVKRDQ